MKRPVFRAAAGFCAGFCALFLAAGAPCGAYDFGLKINRFTSIETDAYFNVFYGGARPLECNLRTLFLPKNRSGELLRAMFGDAAYANLRSIGCEVLGKNRFLWLIFEQNRLKQIKYESSKSFAAQAAELAANYRQIARGAYKSEAFFMDYYDEFFIAPNTICSGADCREFAIFDFAADVELLLIDASERGSVVVLRDKMLVARMSKIAAERGIKSNQSYEED